jgi:L-asparagine transporter-like permease
MVGIAGFFAFAAVAVELLRWLGAEVADGTASYWITYVIGGAIGFFLILLIFDWALIVLTSLAGAGATATGIDYFVPNEPRWLQVVLWVVVFVGGVMFQRRSLRGRRRARA